MFTVENIIGDVIFVSFQDKSMLNHIGIDLECGHFKVLGYDHLGLWLEHPGLYIVSDKKNAGKSLKSSDSNKEHIDANIFVHWSNIKTLMHYPNRKGFDFPSEFDRDIGFKIKE